jgi:uncharacterized protein
MTSGAIVVPTALQVISAHREWAIATTMDPEQPPPPPPSSYGSLSRVADATTGREILALPAGFRYATFSWTGSRMTDGSPTPALHDGMAAFPGPDGTVRLIRNHEVWNRPGNLRVGTQGPVEVKYDPRAGGGVVTLDYHPQEQRVMRDFVSLSGTLANCSGGVNPYRAGWFSCEESVEGPRGGYGQKHGYVFYVPLYLPNDRAQLGVPIRPMGRFVHEAVVVESRRGIYYMTEDDQPHSGFYRYLPADSANPEQGGTLEMLAVRDQPGFWTIDSKQLGATYPVDWVTIDRPDPDLEGGEPNCFDQGTANGGARFRRLEGAWPDGQGSVYFTSTDGGNAYHGQIWRYTDDGAEQTLTLMFESPGPSVLDSPDNLCITPRGGVLICEDDVTPASADTFSLAPGLTQINRLVGLSGEGVPFVFAVNCMSPSELSGVCFSPDGNTLFFNVYGVESDGTGCTVAVTGPWADGPL